MQKRSVLSLLTIAVSSTLLLTACQHDENSHQQVKSEQKSIKQVQNLSATTMSLPELDPLPDYGTSYKVGAGIADITGEVAESNMFGYADQNQVSTGIQQRLHARAFVIGDGQKDVLMIVTETGMVSQAIHQHILKQLNQRYGNRFHKDNVIITANHSHSTPGGISHYFLYNLTTRGFQEPTFDALSRGIMHAVDRAVKSQTDGSLAFGTNQLTNASVQRSMTAYVNNPEAKQDPKGIDPLVQVLTLRDKSGKDIASINWFAVHATSLSNHNTLVLADNKGYASWFWETQKGMDYLTGNGYIAAFANSNPGDMSPNLLLKPGKGPTDNEWENAKIIGQRQADAAMNTPMSTVVTGNIDYRQNYVDMSNQYVNAKYTVDGKDHQTCPAAYKTAFASGSTEDGGGGDGLSAIVKEGHKNPVIKALGYVMFAPTKEMEKCQETDQVAITMGTTKPFPMTPEVLSSQLVRIGNLAIIALPGEFTVVAGKRIREIVAKRLNLPLENVIFAGFSNAYAGYNTTPEEYQRQDYEGASTHFGPHTLEAWEQNLDKLAIAMVNNQPVDTGPMPRDLSKHQVSMVAGVVYDMAPIGKKFGDIAQQPALNYQRGKQAKAIFWSAHPKSTLAYERQLDQAGQRMVEPYTMAIQYKNGNQWQTIATDNDWNTINKWQRILAAQSHAILTWDIPTNVKAGEYRFYHKGAYRNGWTGKYIPFEGYSRSFTVH